MARDDAKITQPVWHNFLIKFHSDHQEHQITDLILSSVESILMGQTVAKIHPRWKMRFPA
jgi:hypothetical protein